MKYKIKHMNYLYLFLILVIFIAFISWYNMNEAFDVYDSDELLPNNLKDLSVIQCGKSNSEIPPFYRYDSGTLYEFPDRKTLDVIIGKKATNQNIRDYIDNISIGQNTGGTYWITNKEDCDRYFKKYNVTKKI
jgi:hypothetical protein